jgi:hypothetical protein
MTEKSIKQELLEAAEEFRAFIDEMKETLQMDDEEQIIDFLHDFFKDYNSSYSLSLAYPESLWKITAANMGLDVEGKDRLQLAKEVFSNIPQGPSDVEKSADSSPAAETEISEGNKNKPEA